MGNTENITDLRKKISDICHEINQLLLLVNEKLSQNSSFVFSEEYREMKDELRVKNAALKQLKASRQQLQHCYSLLIKGDVLRNGKLVQNCPVSYDIMSVIDCNLGDQTRLSKSVGTHNALWNLICTKFGAIFHNRKFSMEYIVQLR